MRRRYLKILMKRTRDSQEFSYKLIDFIRFQVLNLLKLLNWRRKFLENLLSIILFQINPYLSEIRINPQFIQREMILWTTDNRSPDTKVSILKLRYIKISLKPLNLVNSQELGMITSLIHQTMKRIKEIIQMKSREQLSSIMIYL